MQFVETKSGGSGVVIGRLFVVAVVLLGVLVSLQAVAHAGLVFELNFEGTLESSQGHIRLGEDEFRDAKARIRREEIEEKDDPWKWLESEPEFVQGRVGLGLKADDGVSSIIYNVTGSLLPQKGTLEVWFRPNWSMQPGGRTGTNSVLMWWGDHDWVNDALVWVWSQWTTNMHLHNKERRTNVGYTFDWQEGEWNHVAATWTQGMLKLYINGEFVGDKLGMPPLGEEIFLTVGHHMGSWIADGVIDELKIYDHVMSDKEIQDVYNSY